MRKRIKYRTALIRAFFLLFSCAYVLLVLLNVNTWLSTSVNQTVTARRNETVLLNDTMDTMANNVSSIQNLLSDNYIEAMLTKPVLSARSAATLHSYIHYQELSLQYKIRDMSIPFEVIILGTNGFWYCSPGAQTGETSQSVQGSSWYAQCRNSGKQKGFVTNTVDCRGDFAKDHLLIGYRNYYTLNAESHYVYRATVAICIDCEWVDSLYQKSIDPGVSVYLFNEIGELFSSNAADVLADTPDTEITSFLQNAEDSSYQAFGRGLLMKSTSPVSYFTVVERIPNAMIFSEFGGMLTGIILIAVLVYAAILFLIMRLSKAMTTPLDEFCEKLQKTDYQSQMQVPEKIRYEEIAQLYDSFGYLQKRNAWLIGRQLDSEKRLKKQELQFLRAQINPHFLYNTLFSIKCTAKMGKVEDACTMLGLLEDMLRKNLHSVNETQPLFDEILAVRDYVELTKYGLDNRLEFRYEMADDLHYKRIMKFLLQPLVENAVFHGIEPVDHDGIITLKVLQAENRLHITVTDNGAGMPEETLRKLNLDDSEKEQFRGHIGVGNVRSRIREAYGEEFGLKFCSKEMEGTTAELILPLLEEREEPDEENTDR